MCMRRAVTTILMLAFLPFLISAADSSRGKKSSYTARGAEGTALGIVLGQPTGITARFGIGAANSIEVKAAWDLATSQEGDASFSFQGNWLIEFPGVLRFEKIDIPPFVGAGVQLDVGSGFLLGFRIPAGLVYRFDTAPLELFIELGLGMGLVPSTKPLISGGLGARYIFGPLPKR